MANESLSFLVRLKQHHLYGVVVAYAVVVGFLIQLVSRAFPYFGWAGAVPAVIIILIAGFPVVVVLGWLFIKPKDPAKTDTWQRRHWRVSAAVTVVVIVLVVISGFYALLFSERHAARLETASVAAPSQSASADNTVPAAVMAIPAKSVAVLPFENLSTDKANAYFADGMQDLILTKLADIGDLKVISRTSTMQYASHPGDLKTIGEQLGVATILEGSVQKAGNQVLINVQLIDASTDDHIWAQSYQRTLDNIFGVEGEVAEQIAAVLNAKLTPHEASQLAKTGTHNKRALDAYLRADYYVGKYLRTDDIADWKRSLELLKQALKFDPGYADAWATLALTYSRFPEYGQQQREAVQRALELAPDNADAHRQMAFVLSKEGKPTQALAEAERAVKLAPTSMAMWAGLGNVQSRAGELNASIATYNKVLSMPGGEWAALFAADPLVLERRYAEARDLLQNFLVTQPDNVNAAGILAYIEVVGWGDLNAARKVLQAVPTPIASSGALSDAWYWQDMYTRDYAAALDVIGNAPATWFTQQQYPRALYQAQVWQAQGNAAKARAAFAAARTQFDAWIKATPDNASLHANLALVLAGLGENAQALNEARHAVALKPVSRDANLGPQYLTTLAAVQARIENAGAATKTLDQLLAMPAGGSISVPLLKLDPTWDPIRKDPRFRALLKKYAKYKPTVIPTPATSASTDNTHGE